MIDQLVGIDTSHWQDAPDKTPLPDFAAGAGQYSFGIPKCSDGVKVSNLLGLEAYRDKEFIYAFTELGKLGKPRAAYHYFQSGTDGKKQAEIIYNAIDKLGGDVPEMGIEIDVESNNADATIYEYRSTLEKCVVNTERLLPELEVSFYTSYSKWGQFVANPINGPTDLVRGASGGARGLHVANYQVTRPKIPWDWSRRYGDEAWDIWQTGTMYLAGFKNWVDRNVTRGGPAWFLGRYGVDVTLPKPPEPPPPPPPPIDVMPAWVTIKGLTNGETLRMRASIFGTVVGKTWNGAEFDVMGQAKDPLGRWWFQLGPSIWVASWYCEPAYPPF